LPPPNNAWQRVAGAPRLNSPRFAQRGIPCGGNGRNGLSRRGRRDGGRMVCRPKTRRLFHIMGRGRRRLLRCRRVRMFRPRHLPRHFRITDDLESTTCIYHVMSIRSYGSPPHHLRRISHSFTLSCTYHTPHGHYYRRSFDTDTPAKRACVIHSFLASIHSLFHFLCCAEFTPEAKVAAVFSDSSGRPVQNRFLFRPPLFPFLLFCMCIFFWKRGMWGRWLAYGGWLDGRIGGGVRGGSRDSGGKGFRVDMILFSRRWWPRFQKREKVFFIRGVVVWLLSAFLPKWGYFSPISLSLFIFYSCLFLSFLFLHVKALYLPPRFLLVVYLSVGGVCCLMFSI
jgi:hypothetical protein